MHPCLKLAAVATLVRASTPVAARPDKIAKDLPKRGMVDAVIQFKPNRTIVITGK